MVLRRTSLVKFLFFLFLFLHAVPLIFNQSYQIITILNYSIVIFSLLIISSFNNKKMSLISIIYMSLICVSVGMSVLGFSGSISSLVMAASLPHFLFSGVNSKKDFLKLFYQPIILSSFLLIIFSAFLYTSVKGNLGSYSYLFVLGEYFVIASINYVPLVFISMSLIAYSIFKTKAEHLGNTRYDIILFNVLVLLTIFYSSIFLTRSVFMSSLILLYAYLKKVRTLLLLSIPIGVVYNIDIIIPIFSNFFGADNFLDIILSADSRTDSARNLINSSLYHIFYNLDYSNQMSYSTITNLLFSMFPLTFIFLYSPFNALIAIIKKREVDLFLVFLSSFTVVLFQMDFFSIFAFFFFTEYVRFFIYEEYVI
jgi:hypothetical protein